MTALDQKREFKNRTYHWAEKLDVEVVWLTMRRWLEANPDDAFTKDVRAKPTSEPERYAAFTREYLGWGVFALMTR